MKKHLTVALAYNGLCTFEFGCAVEIFGIKRPELGVRWYEFAIHAVDKRPIRATGGFTLQIPASHDLIERADTIIVPGWRDIDAPVPAKLIAQLRRAHERGARICSICSGTFVLAACGLLDGKAATTHWRFTQKLADRYPQIDVRPNALYVEQGNVITSAGSAAGLDMLLHIVRSDHGSHVANLVAQRLVIPAHRDGDQAQFISRPLEPEGRGRIATLLASIRANLGAEHNIERWASQAAMSRRTLQRHFLDATGQTPIDWLTRERLARARELLESSSLSISKIMEASGFRSEESFRRHFRHIVGISPSAYQKRFRQI